MKKELALLLLGLGFMNTYAALDLAPSNLSSNIYYDNYNAQTKTIEGIHFMVLENDGSSTLNEVPDFTVKLYLYVSEQEYYFIKTIPVSGFHEMSARTLGDYDEGQPRIDVDISTVSEVPSGTYRLGVYVDADEQISETNENNNAILFSGEIEYTKGPVQTDKADLTITGQTYTYDPESQSLQNVTVMVRNNGSASAASSTIKITVIQSGFMNADMSSTQSMDIVAPGSTVEVSLNNVDLTSLFGFDPHNPENSYKMIFTVDADNEVSESDENNNIATVDPINFSQSSAIQIQKRSPQSTFSLARSGNKLVFQLGGEQALDEIQIFNSKGRLVMNVPVSSFVNNSGSISIPVGRLASGSYYIAAKVNGVKFSQNFSLF